MKKFWMLILAVAITSALATQSGAMMGGSTGTMPADPGTMMGDDTGTMPTDPGTMMGDPGTNMAGTMQMPTHQEMFNYGPVDSPVVGADMQGMMPVGVGSVATGGDMLTIHAAISEFESPVDMYMAVYAPSVDPFNVYLMDQDGAVQPMTMGAVAWKEGVTSVDDVVANMPASSLPSGNYMLGLMVTPAGDDMSKYYLWTTNFVIQ